MNLPSYTTSQKAALAGGALMVGGAALPWTTGSDAVAFVLRGDQFVTLLAGISVLGIVVIREWTMLEWFGVALFGGLTGYFAISGLRLLLNTGYAVGPGLVIQLSGGALAVVAAAYATVEGPTDETGVGGEPDEEWEGAIDDAGEPDENGATSEDRPESDT